MDHTTALAAIGFMRERYAERIVVDDIADHVGYSPAHFARSFARVARLGPGQYLSAIRFDAAKRLLLAEDFAVAEVCAAVGFDSLPTFTRRFARAVGTTPAALRRVAESVGEQPPRPFEQTDAQHDRIRVHITHPVDGWSGADTWLGWYRQPAPIGLPLAGVLVRDRAVVDLPMCPGAPWLLAFAVPPAAEIGDHFALGQPVVAVHPEPILPPVPPGRSVALDLGPAPVTSVPLLSALPVLWEQKRRNG